LKIYVSVDGNRIGSKIEALMIRGDIPGVTALSRQINTARIEVEHQISQLGGEVIFSGGDSVFAQFHSAIKIADVTPLVDLFFSISGCTASAGIGTTPQETYLALKLAKGSDGISVVDYRQ